MEDRRLGTIGDRGIVVVPWSAEMWLRLVSVLCWLVMLGNLLMAATVPTLIVRSKGELLAFATQMCITNILSFCCAFILRARIVRDRQRCQEPISDREMETKGS
jgi:hypothetical protein